MFCNIKVDNFLFRGYKDTLGFIVLLLISYSPWCFYRYICKYNQRFDHCKKKSVNNNLALSFCQILEGSYVI